ncbi:MAG TPA: pitrilysin family protein [Methylomirabilota bacterium]|nr:pitrilysin family protein [Methylomirabilota bacterium]
MKFLRIVLGLWCLGATLFAQSMDRKFFPYPYTIDDFTNGLRLITVPTDHPNLVALYLIVRTGSRNEIEPGKSGYAHFFEHMMFRGSERFSSDERELIMKRAGADSNAYTSDDRTVYHVLVNKADLEKMVELEADRFQRLKYSKEGYRTEALAVLGEYNKNSANPFSKLHEVLRETAFDKHTYKHTTMGFLKDIEDMPNQYDYSLVFYDRWYRPEYTTIVMVGDITQERARELTTKHFGQWQRGKYEANIPKEDPQTAPRKAHVPWPSPTLPYVVVAYRGPAYSDAKKDKAALDLLSPIAFGQNSDLYRKLVLNEQKVDAISPNFDDQIDPELFSIYARVKDPKDVDYVRDQILATFKRFSEELVSQTQLDETRSRQRYGTALQWTSAEAIAGYLASYIAIARTPETIEKEAKIFQSITPEDIREMARKYFNESSRTVVTLASEPASKEAK